MYRLLVARNRRRLSRFAKALSDTASVPAVAYQLPPLHDASAQTVLLRSGIALGLVSPLNFTSDVDGENVSQ
jgi:hypothetical protein